MKTQTPIPTTIRPKAMAGSLRTTCAVRLLALLLLALPAIVKAQTYTNSYGIWNYANNGNDTCAITGYTGTNTVVTIPNTISNLTVISIGDGEFFGVFFENTSLTSVTIPNSVTGIGDGSFADCTSLTSVIIGNSVTSIGDGSSGDGVFQGCTSLTSITIPDSVTSILSQAFLGCSSLTNAIIGNGVMSIGNSAFYDCSSLANVTIGNSVTNIGDSAFLQCYPLTGVTIPNSVTTIGNNAFFYCESMTNVIFGTNVTTIGSWAFEQCYGFTNLTIPNSVTNIEYGAFLSCVNLTKVYFQGNAPSLGGSVFAYDNNLSVFYYLPGTSGWGSTFYGVPAVMNPPVNPAGSLQVNNIPDGAQWQVDGGLPQPGGATVLGLTVGNHTVSFSSVAGWTTPPTQTVNVSANVTNVINASYTSQPPLQVTTTELDDGMIGEDYDEQLFASYGQAPYSWSLISGSLPPGFELTPDGFIAGTPTNSGTFNFTAQVTDAFSEIATQALSLTIQKPVIIAYPVSESWSVTLTLGTGTGLSTHTYNGTETGTLTITNWNYQLINHTGYPVSGNIDLSRSIVYSYGDYEIDGSECGNAGVGGEFYAIIPLNFFLIKIPIGSESGFSGGWAAYSYPYSATGTSLGSFSGSGAYRDNNYPDDDLGYMNEVDWSSTSSMTLPPPPTCQVTMPTSGSQVSNANFTITGTAQGGAGVASVWYQLNGTGWNLANTTDNWTNWSANVTLAPGTNMLQVYAIDNLSDDSATSTVTFKYVVSAPLTVQVTGRGTVTPDYSNAVLQVGTSYTMTAATVAGSGFAFTNWTGGTNLPLTVITNGATVKFVMTSNLVLQANFVDTNKPTLTITAPISGQRWSNAVFIATGMATDNVAVASVFYSLNSTSWSNAVTGNNWTNWTALVTLVPGTNTITAYTKDTSGNLSTTNRVSFDFVVTNQLQIRTIGLGTISPNYSNAWLEIGRNYSITSSPAGGFIFANWAVSTNWIGGTAMTGTNLQFMMESNLTLQANFVETNKPTLTITAPTAGQHMTNALAAVTGTTSDKWGVTGVWYQLNNGTWNASATTNGWTNWTTTVELISGTNTVKAYAMNLGGNISTNSSVSMVSSNTFMLQLAFTSALPLETNGLVFSLQLSTGLNGHIQVSTNLTTWTTLTNFVGTNSTITFRDPAATNFNSRFYRAVIP